MKWRKIYTHVLFLSLLAIVGCETQGCDVCGHYFLVDAAPGGWEVAKVTAYKDGSREWGDPELIKSSEYTFLPGLDVNGDGYEDFTFINLKTREPRNFNSNMNCGKGYAVSPNV